MLILIHAMENVQLLHLQTFIEMVNHLLHILQQISLFSLSQYNSTYFCSKSERQKFASPRRGILKASQRQDSMTSISSTSSAGSSYSTSSSYSVNSELQESILCFQQHVCSCTTTSIVDDFYTQMIETSFKTNIHLQVMDTQVTDHHSGLVSVPQLRISRLYDF